MKSLIDRSLRKLGVLAAGAQADPTEYADGLDALRLMLDGWSLEDLLIPFHPTELFAFEPGRAIYSIGTGGDWDTTRPEQVLTIRGQAEDGTTWRIAPTSTAVLADMATVPTRRAARYVVQRDARFVFVEFDAYPEAGTSALVTTLKPFAAELLENFDAAYDPGTTPGTIHPSGFTLTGIGTEIDFPSGYEQAITYNLALHLAPEYPGVTVPQEVVAFAANGKRLIKRRNWRPMFHTAKGLPGAKGTYDITAGPC